MKEKKIAVIMSIYHKDSITWTKSAIESILKQSYKKFKLFIIVDGYVSIEMRDFVSSYESNEFVNITFREDNLGLAVSLNELIDSLVEIGSFDYIARMDSDDIARPERLEKQISFLEQHTDIDVLGGYCHEFGADFALSVKKMPTIHSELIDYSIRRCPFVHPTVMFRCSVFDDGIRYPTNTQFTEDLALWLELLARGRKFANLPEVILDYRINELTLKRRAGLKKALSEIVLRRRYMKLLNRNTILNNIYILSRIPFHLLPHSLLKVCYSLCR
ncbi:glycosyltransferase [Yersinia kristensenii]|uniref:glycosyltransferase n=1 Tax=Yersinia kristensenii TaxID=28152 RepID=UPI0005E0958A|nr:glycosyltransferase [Yersinia kristensenii]CFR04459.1 putative glycosyltransferase [Yersinia kristensenii]